MASGRLLREPVTILEKRRRRKLSATVRTDRQELAEIRIQWTKSETFPGYPAAHGRVIFPDGDGWTMAVEAPDRPPDPPKLLGGLRRPRHSIWERIVRIRDRRGVVVAEASWPESSGEDLEAPARLRIASNGRACVVRSAPRPPIQRGWQARGS